MKCLSSCQSICIPALRALKEVYGRPVTVLHFDAHIDTLDPNSYGSAWGDDVVSFTHGSPFWNAYTEGLINNGSVHAGLRPRLGGDSWADYDADDKLVSQDRD